MGVYFVNQGFVQIIKNQILIKFYVVVEKTFFVAVQKCRSSSSFFQKTGNIGVFSVN